MSAPIRVVVVDDHALSRRDLEAALAAEADIEVVGSAVNSPAAVTLASESRPDVALVDVEAPYEDGIRAVSALKRALSVVRILILTTSDDEAHLFGAVRAGAVGYLLKPRSMGELTAAVRSVHNGASIIGPSVASRVMNEFAATARSEKSPAMPHLTVRELDVLKLMVEGRANQEISRRLLISENTVKNHIRNILEKLQFCARM
ncbi:response regulator transcription factor [Frankia sp. Mgl5]|uniref:response regulator n=1 Tax=Frankia sp. Mgl5 TaxID=2933793 RepID=UPI00200F638E|nr:response regulator transcription factor [Frankia sp. Mgl5]MCK9932765.1 response regulator transcription factor [Frankia sp. Mgl5]